MSAQHFCRTRSFACDLIWTGCEHFQRAFYYPLRVNLQIPEIIFKNLIDIGEPWAKKNIPWLDASIPHPSSQLFNWQLFMRIAHKTYIFRIFCIIDVGCKLLAQYPQLTLNALRLGENFVHVIILLREPLSDVHDFWLDWLIEWWEKNKKKALS